MKMRLQGLSSIVLATLVAGSPQLALADDVRISQLEQEVRELQRQVQQQARRIEILENVARQSRVEHSLPTSAPTQAAKSSDAASAWLHVANWDKLRIGMPETEVVRLLGPPTTVRKATDGATQTLFYTLELAAGGFLSGQVIIAGHRLRELQRPTLK